MPLYEFYCEPCHTIYTFRAQHVDTESVPACPRCGKPLSRQVSSFSHIVRGAIQPESDTGGFDADEIKQAERDELIAKMGRRLDAMGEDGGDPAEAVKVMRQMAAQGGLNFSADVAEAMARIEAGQDPEKIDEQFSEVFDREDPFSQGDGEDVEMSGKQEKKMGWLRHLQPPRRDPKWYDL